MARDNSDFSALETSLEVQPEKGAAEGPIEYGGAAKSSVPRDPMGVMVEGGGKQIGPKAKD
jgi:hypothetical protein